MNVTFHTIAGLATGTALASRIRSGPAESLFEKGDAGLLAAVIAGNALLHGLLDWVKHTYPLNWRVDIVLSLTLIVLTITAIKRRYYLTFAVSFLGALLPDIIDLGPVILNMLLHLDLPTWEIFPWHWARYSGALYDGSYPLVSLINHLLALAGSLALAIRCRRALLTRILRWAGQG